jgi:hypothetical protein
VVAVDNRLTGGEESFQRTINKLKQLVLPKLYFIIETLLEQILKGFFIELNSG